MIIQLEPYYESKVWASPIINDIYMCGDDIGEAWIVSGISNKSATIKNGKYKGKYLSEVVKELYSFEIFPLIIKLIANKDKLSVQVHPDDNLAKKYGETGKLEVFYVLDENKSNKIILGTKAKDKNELLESLFEDTILDKLIYKDINYNDLIEIIPGTIHSLLEESFILEIQQASDITYRLYDFDRRPRRKLHIEDGLAATSINNKGRIINLDGVYYNKYFSIEKFIVKGKIKKKYKDPIVCIILKGNGQINNFKIKKYDTFIINDEEVDYKGNLEIIIVKIEKR
jgi:mannose-6-phosphate isomerase